MRELRQQVAQVRVGLEGERVELARPVERHRRDPVRALEAEMLPLLRRRDRSAKRAHAATLASRAGPGHTDLVRKSPQTDTIMTQSRGTSRSVGGPVDRRQRRGILVLPASNGASGCYPATRAAHKGVPPMQLSPSAHTDTFCRDNLPPADQWPDLRFDLPELRYPERLNCARGPAGRGRGPASARTAPACARPPRPGPTGTCSGGRTRPPRCSPTISASSPATGCCSAGPNNPWLIAAWFGVLKAGGVAVTTMPLLRAREITALAELTRPALAVCDDRFADELTAAAPGLPTVFYGGRSPGGAGDLASRCAAQERQLPGGGHRRRRCRPARPDLRHHREAQGDHALPPGRAGHPRHVRPARARRPARTTSSPGTPPVGFTFGLGGLVVFPFSVGASALLLERAVAGRAGRRDRGARGDGAVHRPHDVPGAAGDRQDRGPDRPAAVRLGR